MKLFLQATSRTGTVTNGPTNSTPPAVSGAAQQGQTVTVTNGVWGGTTPITYSYQWQRSTTGTGGWSNITGATSSSYVLQSADVSDYVQCVVTATSTGPDSPASQASNVIGPVAALVSPPSPVTPPTIS